MLRRIRCRSCGSAFYTHGAARECQDCTDTYDRGQQAAKDAEAIRRATARPDTEPQSVNPRTGKPATRAKKEKAE